MTATSFPLAAELDDHLVEGRDGGDVPEVGVRQVDDHLLHFLPEIETGQELLGAGKEDLAPHQIGTHGAAALAVALDQHDAGNLVGEEEGGEQHPHEDPECQVVGRDHHGDGGYHHQVGGEGWLFGLRTDSQENVPMETMIITATRAAMGI